MANEKWNELPIGGIVDKPATARQYETGKWRVMRPIVDKDKCINCMQCWLYCPDMAITGQLTEDGKKTEMTGIDMTYCKGCGTCAAICPVKAIEMKPESEFLK
ncbi:4Fe-4S binding protein [Oceanotoga sp. DSM 15011]|jgi:pyruvate ferredoxin oxidoreductase delta subunit|uniref:Pyruvate ferredoxin oxidoreductase delta subunit n=1 Tax=Oceanotoga teriensis TaxID=515440 RepID=A0AA45C681_9BACT|nr:MULTISPECIES: 4Fe-4S binding protein [Oceanotoga]MDN5343114.1 pyruvate ferredoxin oxidoreductase delta subunit [Oceanotoga sp.]MDO7977567.1 4Fe-4S binding protein [Oceanotoga teriensis]PWJ91213.1 pyruvate ferredoxin oxidoreductase delta subunit [Oceanotoga teriensis]UYO99688.1 4Fe-4S binding protein [Oceanotoga sp. DSM 15011]